MAAESAASSDGDGAAGERTPVQQGEQAVAMKRNFSSLPLGGFLITAVFGLSFGALVGRRLLNYRRQGAIVRDLEALCAVAGRNARVREAVGYPLSVATEVSGTLRADAIEGTFGVRGPVARAIVTVVASRVDGGAAGAPRARGVVEHVPGWSVSTLVVTPTGSGAGAAAPIVVLPPAGAAAAGGRGGGGVRPPRKADARAGVGVAGDER